MSTHDFEHCQGYVPRGAINDYWNLTDSEKAKIFDFLMKSTNSNIRHHPNKKKDNK